LGCKFCDILLTKSISEPPYPKVSAVPQTLSTCSDLPRKSETYSELKHLIISLTLRGRKVHTNSTLATGQFDPIIKCSPRSPQRSIYSTDRIQILCKERNSTYRFLQLPAKI
jgi:hypothetical protein